MTIPVVLKDFIRKHTINHFHRYIEHLDDENIEKHRTKLKTTTDKPTRKNKEIIRDQKRNSNISGLSNDKLDRKTPKNKIRL